jgi:hypothetical protein
MRLWPLSVAYWARSAAKAGSRGTEVVSAATRGEPRKVVLKWRAPRPEAIFPAKVGRFVRRSSRCARHPSRAVHGNEKRARRVRVVCDLSFTTGLAEPDSRGLVPAIPRRMRSIRPHATPLQETFEVGGFRSAWMPGTSPGKTREGCERLQLCNRFCRTGQRGRGARPGMTCRGCKR